ncbi:PaaI family thioesterase [Streptomyces sp. VRA16 Mangrove soil]|uniref:PaaI family thioesterase n=1 Tax=Streptomyces sp. VRA16 Mangrove soil TaxID=2817434 RepID=UPI001A9FAE11|nr:hypothetical protein [Streptomyces sp. VRA16 Mangrove soil]MBO1336438.1 hypothetical protein [Streptomyces sp. VRA16 Mangrove soil]
MNHLTVPTLYQGYEGIAFGGYVAGRLAALVEAKTVRVDFRGPVPVETPVELHEVPDAGFELRSAEGRVLAAAGAGAGLSGDGTPTPPTLAEAVRAAERLRATLPADAGPDCFGCGLARTPGTGLRLHCGTVDGRDDVVACDWTPDPAHAAPDGTVPPEIVWGALDCPGNWAGRLLGTQRVGAMTASLSASLLGPVVAGAPYVVTAWVREESGRKHAYGMSVSAPDGTLHAVGEALWIDPRP